MDKMKARSTIQRQIRQLKALAEDLATPEIVAGKAYETYHGMRWVLENVDWNPIALLRTEAALEKRLNDETLS